MKGTKDLGARAEEKAKAFLQAQGLRFVTQNYYCPFGEIDLVMQDRVDLVFVEVRARTSVSYGGALQSVGYAKQQKIMRSAQHYLLVHKWEEKMPFRFDIIGLEGKEERVLWMKHAFGMDF